MKDHADRIAKLLRKAEDPKIPQAEAESFLAKAQELMVTYAIDQRLIDAARGAKSDEQIVREQILYHSQYSRALFDIGWKIAINCDCKVIVERGKDLMRTTMHIVGFESDVERVKTLNSSIQIQAMVSLTRWWNDQDDKPTNARERFKARRTFLFSYADGLNARMRLANKSAREEAAKLEALRRGNMDSARDSVALVVRTRQDLLEDHFNGIPTRASKTLRYNSGGNGASSAGYAAGQTANLGDPALRNKRVLSS